MPHIIGTKTIGSKVAHAAHDLAGKVRHAIGRTGGKKLRSSNVVDTGKVTLAKEVQEKRFVTVQDRCAMVVESSIKRGCAEKQWAGRSRGAKTAGPTEEIQPIRSMSKPSPEAPQLQYEPTEGERQNQLNDVMEQLLSRPQDHPRVSPLHTLRRPRRSGCQGLGIRMLSLRIGCWARLTWWSPTMTVTKRLSRTPAPSCRMAGQLRRPRMQGPCRTCFGAPIASRESWTQLSPPTRASNVDWMLGEIDDVRSAEIDAAFDRLTNAPTDRRFRVFRGHQASAQAVGHDLTGCLFVCCALRTVIQNATIKRTAESAKQHSCTAILAVILGRDQSSHLGGVMPYDFGTRIEAFGSKAAVAAHTLVEKLRETVPRCKDRKLRRQHTVDRKTATVGQTAVEGADRSTKADASPRCPVTAELKKLALLTRA